MSATTASHTTAERPRFGVILSLLAILLTLVTISRLFSAVSTMLFLYDEESSKVAIALDFIIGGWGLLSLVLLVGRRRWFIGVYGALLLFNIVTLWVVVAPELFAAEESPERQAAVTMLTGQTSIGAAWLVYLARSQHVREVCIE